MDNENKDPVLRAAHRERAELQRQIGQLDEFIRQRKHELMGSRPDASTYPQVRPGQYLRIKMTNALENYLTERGGGPIPMKRVVLDLEVAGVDMGQERRHQQNLKIAMSAGSNTNKFCYDKKTDSVSLVNGPTAPQ